MSKLSFGEYFHANLSLFLATRGIEVAWISSLIPKGRLKGIFDQSHLPKDITSLSLRLNEFRGRGPWMRALMEPRLDQQSDQKSRLLSCLGIHFNPILKVASPIFIPFQVGELGSLASFLELILCLVQYLYFRTLAQGASFSVWNLQFSLARRVVFLPLADYSPRPPNSLGLVTASHLTQCIFLAWSDDPHKKFLLTLSMPLRILFESEACCMT